VLPAAAQHALEAAAVAGAGAQQLVAYMPPQLVALLRQLVSELTADVQQAAHVGQAVMAEQEGVVSYDVAASALQVRCCQVQGDVQGGGACFASCSKAYRGGCWR
jgi:hypothetical protein